MRMEEHTGVNPEHKRMGKSKSSTVRNMEGGNVEDAGKSGIRNCRRAASERDK